MYTHAHCQRIASCPVACFPQKTRHSPGRFPAFPASLAYWVNYKCPCGSLAKITSVLPAAAHNAISNRHYFLIKSPIFSFNSVITDLNISVLNMLFFWIKSQLLRDLILSLYSVVEINVTSGYISCSKILFEVAQKTRLCGSCVLMLGGGGQLHSTRVFIEIILRPKGQCCVSRELNSSPLGKKTQLQEDRFTHLSVPVGVSSLLMDGFGDLCVDERICLT